MNRIISWEKIVAHFLKLHKNYLAFLKSDVGSACSAVVDYSTLFITIHLLGWPAQNAVPLGIALGGIVYFLVASLWAFRDTKRNWKGESWRFLVIWVVSLLFNSVATLYLNSIGMNVFLARVFASIVISLLWSFPLERYWVFPEKK